MLLAAAFFAPSAAAGQHGRHHCRSLGATGPSARKARGTTRPDRLCGSHRDDRIFGRGGHDVLAGRRGDDLLVGGRGRDSLFGGLGRDRLSGGPGHDRLAGGRGRDVVRGGAGPDRVRGGLGSDHLYGGRGPDRVNAADRAFDVIRAGHGDDRVLARDGVRDSVGCGPGQDTAKVDSEDVVHGCETVELGSPSFALPSWSDATFFQAKNYTTIQAGDVDGDGQQELLALGPSGIEIWHFEKEYGEWAQEAAEHAPLTEPIWSQAAYYSTIQTLDVNGDGRDELLARGPEGLRTWEYEPATSSWSELQTANDPFSDADAWNVPSAYETVTADYLFETATAHAIPIVYGRKDGGFRAYTLVGGVWKEGFDGNGFEMTDEENWNQPGYYKTLQLADLNGDGRKELIARSAHGLVAWNPFTGEQTITGGHFSNAEGWNQPRYYETFQAVDLNGDGKDEVIGRGEKGVQVYSPAEGKLLAETGPFTDEEGFTSPSSYETLQAADLSSRPGVEVLARTPAGLRSYAFANGSWQPTSPVEGDLGNQKNWNQPRYYKTIQPVDASDKGPELLVARGATGVMSLQPAGGGSESWSTTARPFPAYSGGERAAAYQAIDEELGKKNRGFDLRKAFAATENRPDFAQLQTWQGEVQSMGPPEGVSKASWEEVKSEILAELDHAVQVAFWFETYLPNIYQEIFTAENMDPAAERLKFDVESAAQLRLQEWQAMVGTLYGMLEFSEAGPEGIGTAATVVAALAGIAITNGVGAPNIEKSIEGINGTYREIKSKLQSTFTKTLDSLSEQEAEIIGDYGRQSAVGQMIETDVWGTESTFQSAASIAQAQRNYEVSVWKTIVPGIWSAWSIAPEVSEEVCEERGSSEEHRPSACEWTGPNGNQWRLDVIESNGECASIFTAPCNAPPVELRHALFGPTQEGCTAAAGGSQLPNWESGRCNLGVAPSEVFEEWGLTTYECLPHNVEARCHQISGARRKSG